MGQLGNHMWTFLTGLAYKVTYGLEHAILGETKDYLAKYFKGLESRRTLEKDYCFFNDFYSQYLDAFEAAMAAHYERLSGVQVNFTREEDHESVINRPDLVHIHGKMTHRQVTDGFSLPTRWCIRKYR